MRNVSITVLISIVLLLPACARLFPGFPAWPATVTKQFYIDIDPRTKNVLCFEFKILNVFPYKLDPNPRIVDLMNCQGLGGFNPDDMVEVVNWVNDSQDWAKKAKCQYK